MYFAGVGMMTNLECHTAVNDVTQPSSTAATAVIIRHRVGARAARSQAPADDPAFQAVSNHLKMIHFSSWPGFVPAIHVFPAQAKPRRGCPAQGRA
jgi:hypothetical protein